MTKAERKAFERVTRLMPEAVSLDPAAFPRHGMVVYWPEISDARQRAAFDRLQRIVPPAVTGTRFLTAAEVGRGMVETYKKIKPAA